MKQGSIGQASHVTYNTQCLSVCCVTVRVRTVHQPHSNVEKFIQKTELRTKSFMVHHNAIRCEIFRLFIIKNGYTRRILINNYMVQHL